MTAWIRRRRATARARALKALDVGIAELQRYHSWKQIQFNAPPGTKMDLKARDEAQKAAQRSFNAFVLVRIALGYDPEADEPEPKRHWDAGA